MRAQGRPGAWTRLQCFFIGAEHANHNGGTRGRVLVQKKSALAGVSWLKV